MSGGSGRDLALRIRRARSTHWDARTTDLGSKPMSTAPVTEVVDPAVRRVRHQARDAVVLMSFSLATSLAVAAAFLLLAGLGR
jgi:hypothetical protein